MASQVKSVALVHQSPTNIAEGCGRDSAADFARFLQISMGSASESEYLILLAHDLKFLNPRQFDELTNAVITVKKMVTIHLCWLSVSG